MKSAIAISVAALLCACAGHQSEPERVTEGKADATISELGTAISVSVDAGDVYVILIDKQAGTPSLSVVRVRGSEVTTMPTQFTDLSDYAASGLIGINATITAHVSDGTAYFMGAYGMTVAPLDGSPSTTFYPPIPGFTDGHDYDVFQSFAVDNGFIYVCESDIRSGTTNFGRFDADGNWQQLFMGSLPELDERCGEGMVAVDADSVYWATSQAIRAYDKSSGTVRTLVDLEEVYPPSFTSVAGDAIAWFDFSDYSFRVASKTGVTSSLHDSRLLFQRQLVDEVAQSMIATKDALYWLTPFELHRLTIADGKDELLAQRHFGGLYRGLATDGQNLYFSDAQEVDGGVGHVVLRSVSQ